MGPRSQAAETVTEFCNALPTSHFTSGSERKTAKHVSTRLSQHRNCGNNGEEEEDEVTRTCSKNKCRNQETVGMQVESRQAGSRRTEDTVIRRCHQRPEKMQNWQGLERNSTRS